MSIDSTNNNLEVPEPKAEDLMSQLLRELALVRKACRESSSANWHMLNLIERLNPVPKPAYRVLDRMTDVDGARRLLIMWVPRSAGRRWFRFPWGFRAGRLWVQFSPEPKER
jgi:hypothetical protein